MSGVTRIPRSVRVAARIAGGAAIVAGTALVVGVGPFLRGLAAVSPPAILLAVALTAVATAAAAWRWQTVAVRLGLPLHGGTAVAAYYRSQFLNTVLPGGILGDVDRAYGHGRRNARIGQATRAVAVERIAGQVVQVLATLALLMPLGLLSPRSPAVWAAGVGAAAVVVVVGAAAVVPHGRRALHRELALLRPLFSRPRTVLVVVGASLVVVAAHAAMFVVAALAVGVSADPDEIAVVALIVLAASAIPLSIGGWGPREAVAGSAFAVIGLGAGTGVAVSTTFGVLAMIAVAPGAVVLLAGIPRVLTARTQRSSA
jgi:uncharacterized membrane protein YbhN (UPF0104 family)